MDHLETTTKLKHLIEVSKYSVAFVIVQSVYVFFFSL